MVVPTDFYIPFDKSHAQVMIHDRVLFIPPKADRSRFVFPGWNADLLFGSSNNPIAVEFCSGNGCWIVDKARTNPHINWVAVEKRFDRARKIWVKIKNYKLNNVIVVFGEALTFSTSCMPNQSIYTLYVNFPDPWPKQRHTKHRIISPLFFHEAARVLREDGRLIFVTDDLPYSEWFLHLYEAHKSDFFTSAIPAPYVAPPPCDYGTSFFDTLFRQQGKQIYYHQLIRTSVWCPDVCHLASLPSSGLLTTQAHEVFST